MLISLTLTPSRFSPIHLAISTSVIYHFAPYKDIVFIGQILVSYTSIFRPLHRAVASKFKHPCPASGSTMAFKLLIVAALHGEYFFCPLGWQPCSGLKGSVLKEYPKMQPPSTTNSGL